jgi:hypothetical protein
MIFEFMHVKRNILGGNPTPPFNLTVRDMVSLLMHDFFFVEKKKTSHPFIKDILHEYNVIHIN